MRRNLEGKSQFSICRSKLREEDLSLSASNQKNNSFYFRERKAERKTVSLQDILETKKSTLKSNIRWQV